ncbi:MAG: hypothetical protein NUV51_04585, partial [Sulfuricaulis sp.]|nr:hypothetical protein [Sulfuricaulis sp.]
GRLDVSVVATGYWRKDMSIEASQNVLPVALVAKPAPVTDPWVRVTEAQLRAWRGAISTVLVRIPCGPRPGQADNVLFTDEYDSSCYSAGDRATMRAAYAAFGYTHWPIGPLVGHGYHGDYPSKDFRSHPDRFLDRVEELWQGGFYPAIFLLPDIGGNTGADGRHIDRARVEQSLTPIYRSPRFQALARIVVLAWEPEYSASDWQWGVRWMARVFPHALRYVHFPSGHGAPCLGSELGSSLDEAGCWRAVAPSIHGFLQQETWVFGGLTNDGRTPEEEFRYDLLDMVRRFTWGSTGACHPTAAFVAAWAAAKPAGKPACGWDGSWPTRGASARPLDVVAYEYASYYVYAEPSLASKSIDWGRIALTLPGVAGYGDGGPRP